MLTPKARLYLTAWTVLFKASFYFMDWNEKPFPDHLLEGAAISGGIIFPVLYSLESAILQRR